MFKHLLSAAILVLLSTGAEAATIYTLNNITYLNSFGTNPVVCTGCGTGTAVDDGAGNITLTGIAWFFTGGGNEYSASFDGTTTLAPTMTPPTSPANALPDGSQLNTTNVTCTTVFFGSTDPCAATGYRSSYAQSVYYTGFSSNPVTTTCGQAAVPTNINATNRCRVDLSVAGSTLTMKLKRALSESAGTTSFQELTFSFESAGAVPVPAAVWLFGSALGLLGLARRRPT